MSNQQTKNFNVRLSRPQSLAGALGGLLKICGIRASDADFSAHWNKIMGKEIADIATLVVVKKTRDNKYNISIRPKTPAFALQLSYQKLEIIRRINGYFGENSVGKITFRK